MLDTRISAGRARDHPRADVDREARRLVAAHLELARVQSDAQHHPQSRAARTMARGTAIARAGPSKVAKKPSPSSPLSPRNATSSLADRASWASEQVPPLPVAHRRRRSVEPTMSVNRTVARTRSGSANTGALGESGSSRISSISRPSHRPRAVTRDRASSTSRGTPGSARPSAAGTRAKSAYPIAVAIHHQRRRAGSSAGRRRAACEVSRNSSVSLGASGLTPDAVATSQLLGRTSSTNEEVGPE